MCNGTAVHEGHEVRLLCQIAPPCVRMGVEDEVVPWLKGVIRESGMEPGEGRVTRDVDDEGVVTMSVVIFVETETRFEYHLRPTKPFPMYTEPPMLTQRLGFPWRDVRDSGGSLKRDYAAVGSQIHEQIEALMAKITDYRIPPEVLGG